VKFFKQTADNRFIAGGRFGCVHGDRFPSALILLIVAFVI
jgi:hypothetical protein